MALELVRVWDFGQLVFRRSVGARHESCETSMNTSSVDEEVEDEDARLARLRRRVLAEIKRRNKPRKNSRIASAADATTPDRSGSGVASTYSSCSSSSYACSSESSGTDGEAMNFAMRRKRAALERVRSAADSATDSPVSEGMEQVLDSVTAKLSRLHSPMKVENGPTVPVLTQNRGCSLLFSDHSARSRAGAIQSNAATSTTSSSQALVPYQPRGSAVPYRTATTMAAAATERPGEDTFTSTPRSA